MKQIAGLIILLGLLSAAGAEIRLAEPPDKAQLFSETVMLRGQILPAGEFAINGNRLRTGPEGSFFCGLVLKPGKNYVEVRRGDEKKALRILKATTFPDIEMLYEDKRHWARSQIVYLSTLGFIEGYPDGYFHPGNPVTRGEFATWLARTKILPIPKLTADVFFDVPKEHWRAPYIKAIVEAAYLPGFSGDIFGIDEPISRREAAAIAVRVEGVNIIEKIKPLFKDVPPQEKGAAPIYTAREKGLVIGVSEQFPIFDPDRAITRAEAAMLLSRFTRAQESFRYLFDYEQGYTPARFCRLNLPPQIIEFTVQPDMARLKQAAAIKLRANLASRLYLYPLSKVKADLSSFGGMPDAEMFDDGTHGDEKKGDLIYSLNFTCTPLESGEKKIDVLATDQLGWEGRAEAALLVIE